MRTTIGRFDNDYFRQLRKEIELEYIFDNNRARCFLKMRVNAALTALYCNLENYFLIDAKKCY